MRAILIRNRYDTFQTTGTLLVVNPDGKVVFSSLCLELPWRNNDRSVSCAPAGVYELVLEYSPAFQMELWELKGVPGRAEIKIHTANYVRQLNGCIAPGKDLIDIDGDGKKDVTNSDNTRKAFHRALDGMKKTTITIYGQA